MKKIFTTEEVKHRSYISASFINSSGTHVFITLQEGTGDNLLREDEEYGYVDYVDYTFIESDDGLLLEPNGGMLLLKEYVADLYSTDGLCSEEIFDEVLKMEDLDPISDIFIM